VALLEDAERKTAHGARLHLRLAIDYSSRQAILDAARQAASCFGAGVGEQQFGALIGPDVDVLIRTSGEQRLSDFLLWECAYAELVFTPRMWPDFTAADLAEAVAEFHRRERRFGAVAAVETARRTA
jgi:undecaprenyl diphosphate synthase